MINIPFIGLLYGIGIGLAVGFFIILLKNFQNPFHKELDLEAEEIRLQLSENVSFLNKAYILKTLSDINDDKTVVIDARSTRYIHPDIIEIIQDFESTTEDRNIKYEYLK